MDKIKQIEAFVNAAEKGNLARASLVLGITPVMLGRRIDALERRPGIKLMHRTTRHLTLTERGTVFLDIAVKSSMNRNRPNKWSETASTR